MQIVMQQVNEARRPSRRSMAIKLIVNLKSLSCVVWKKEPSKRPQDGAELARELERLRLADDWTGERAGAVVAAEFTGEKCMSLGWSARLLIGALLVVTVVCVAACGSVVGRSYMWNSPRPHAKLPSIRMVLFCIATPRLAMSWLVAPLSKSGAQRATFGPPHAR